MHQPHRAFVPYELQLVRRPGPADQVGVLDLVLRERQVVVENASVETPVVVVVADRAHEDTAPAGERDAASGCASLHRPPQVVLHAAAAAERRAPPAAVGRVPAALHNGRAPMCGQMLQDDAESLAQRRHPAEAVGNLGVDHRPCGRLPKVTAVPPSDGTAPSPRAATFGKIPLAGCTIAFVKPSWDEVHTAYGPALARVVASYAPPGPDREDLAQEVAMALVRALPAFRGEASLKTYVLRIAHNVSLRHVMRDRRWKVDPIDEITDSAVSAEHRAMQREEGTRLLAAIRELPVGLRQALTLALEELPQREIAEVLGVTENAVAIRMHRARRLLKARLEE